ncbi:vWA domain-containing protein [Pseudomonas sp.]|uniref:vWA domain-containing protein n=1 Tax=Pseudomonas sp. TaxID=306 RepID=UPI003D6FBAE2
MTSISAVPIVDTSASMTQYGFVAQTVICTKAFLSFMEPGDRIGLVSYDRISKKDYPTGAGNQLAVVDQALTVTRDAALAVGRLQFEGSATAIGEGIVEARKLLDNASLPKACVLLTDGEHNSGIHPRDVLPGYPVMTCAMGGASDQRLLQEIADSTSGNYFYAPRAADMMRVYNQIYATSASARLLVNSFHDISQNDYRLIPAELVETAQGAKLSAVWSTSGVTHTTGSPSGNQLSVTLVDPDFVTTNIRPTIVGDGFVIYNLSKNQLKTGRWFIQLEFAGSAQIPAINVTGGAFRLDAASKTGSGFELILPKTIEVGRKLSMDLKLPADLDSYAAFYMLQIPSVKKQGGSSEASLSEGEGAIIETFRGVIRHETSKFMPEFVINTPGSYTLQVDIEGKLKNGEGFQQSELRTMLAMT